MQVGELLEKEMARESLSPCVLPALLVPKKHRSMSICVDKKAINKITVKYKHPIPKLEDIPNELYGSKLFSKVDLRGGYY